MPPAFIANMRMNRGPRAFSESKLSQATTHGAVALRHFHNKVVIHI